MTPQELKQHRIQLFRDLSRDETRHARQLMALLEQNILAF